jgi:hypothetical protein
VTLAPQFPHVPASAGHYESFYLIAHHRSEPVAVWIRYTVHKRPGEAGTGSIWFTLFEPGGPTAVKVTTDEPRADAGQLLAVGSYGAVRTDGADGAITSTSAGVDASWDVRFDPCAEELRHLPYSWMYRAGIPRTKSTSPYPSMRVSGSVTVAGRRLDLDGWVRNCSAAAVSVAIRRRGVAQARLVTAHGGVYELGSPEFDPSVVMQPYSDG